MRTNPLILLGILWKKLEPMIRIERTTYSLRMNCSTN
jgi:hypothetical protein